MSSPYRDLGKGIWLRGRRRSGRPWNCGQKSTDGWQEIDQRPRTPDSLGGIVLGSDWLQQTA